MRREQPRSLGNGLTERMAEDGRPFSATPTIPTEIADQHRDDLSRRKRFADEIPLNLCAPFSAQQIELLFGLHSFRCDGRIEGCAHSDDSPNDRRAIRLIAELADEALIDLDLVEREAAQVAERRVAGSEIVHRNADAQFFDGARTLRRPSRES